MSSYISEVIAPRTERADSRAARRQQKIDDGLLGVERHEAQDVLGATLRILLVVGGRQAQS